MATHIRAERGDGNGTPPGVRLSYAAITVILTTLTLLVGLARAVRTADLSELNGRITRAEAGTEAVDKRRQVDLETIRSDIRDLRLEVRELARNSRADR